MNGDAAVERDLRRFHSVPPTFDVAYHLRELVRVLLPALICAALLAGAAYFYVNSEPKQYENSVTARIESGASTATFTDVTVNTLAPPFIALSKSQPVLELTLQRSHVKMTPEELSNNLTVEVLTSPSLVQVSARADNPKDAIALAEAAVASLDTTTVNIWNDKVDGDISRLQETAGTIGDQMNALPRPSPQHDVLKSEYDSLIEQTKQLQTTQPNRISLLAQSGETTQVAPKPMQQALVVFVASLIVLAELFAFLNGRIGRRTNNAWLRRMAHKHGYGLDRATAQDQAWPAVTQIQLNKRSQVGSGPFALYARESQSAKTLIETAVGTMESAASGTDTPARLPVHSLESEWWRDMDNADRSLAVVVVDTKQTGRSALGDAFDRLDDYGIPVQLIGLSGEKSPGLSASSGADHKRDSTA